MRSQHGYNRGPYELKWPRDVQKSGRIGDEEHDRHWASCVDNTYRIADAARIDRNTAKSAASRHIGTGSRSRGSGVGHNGVHALRIVRIKPVRRTHPPQALDETATEHLKRSEELIERQPLSKSICRGC